MMVKVLPCDNCEDRTAKIKQGGRLIAYTIGRVFGGFPLQVPCAGCKRKTYVSAAKYNALPTVPLAAAAEQLEA